MLLKRICQKIQANMRCLFKIQVRISDYRVFPHYTPQPRNYSPHYGMFTIIGGHIDYLTTKLGGGVTMGERPKSCYL